MDIAAPLMAGLGLFFIGLRLVSTHLKQLAGRRLRRMLATAMAGRGRLALLGLAAGAVMQSLNAVTFVLVALVTAGAIDTRKAFSVINWANIGTSMLVVLAAINLHLAALVLVGLVGLAHYLHLDQSARYRHVVGALLGICLLFLGIDFVKSGSVLLKAWPSLRDALGASSGHSPQWPFLLGMLVAIVAQSSSTVTVIAMAMASAGLLAFETGSLLVVGSGLGSGLSAWLLAGRLDGSARQLILWQVILRASGVLLALLLLALEAVSGWPGLRAALHAWQLSPAAQLAAVFLWLQLLSWLAVALAGKRLVHAVESMAPPSVQELLGKPRYIDDPVLIEEPTSALLLADREQQHLLGFLPQFLDPLRDEASRDGPDTTTLLNAQRQVLRSCDHFLADLVDRHHSRDVQEHSNVLRQRNELLGSLQETLAELARECTPLAGHPQTRSLGHGMVEALHLMLQTLAETAVGRQTDDRALLLDLTQDRSELMDDIRRKLLGTEVHLPQDLQHAALTVTGLFERSVWLMRRYVLHLDLLPAEALA